MRAPRSFALACWLTMSALAQAAPSSTEAQLQQARKHLDELQYVAALNVLGAVEKNVGNTRSQLLELWTMQAMAYGVLGKEAKTRDAFRKLLLVNPTAQPPATDAPPRVRLPFEEARRWAAEHGPLSVVAQVQRRGDDAMSLRFSVQRDVLRMVKTIRVHGQRGDGGVEVFASPVFGDIGALDVSPPFTRWWAEVLGDRDAVLLEIEPREELRPSAALTPAEPMPVPARDVQPEVPRIQSEVAALAPVWPMRLGIALGGAGLATLGMGALFGLQAQSTRTELISGPRDEFGRIQFVNQRDAAQLEALSQSQAMVANVLFGAGAGLAAAGVALVIWAPNVTVQPMAGGAQVRGTF